MHKIYFCSKVPMPWIIRWMTVLVWYLPESVSEEGLIQSSPFAERFLCMCVQLFIVDILCICLLWIALHCIALHCMALLACICLLWPIAVLPEWQSFFHTHPMAGRVVSIKEPVSSLLHLPSTFTILQSFIFTISLSYGTLQLVYLYGKSHDSENDQLCVQKSLLSIVMFSYEFKVFDSTKKTKYYFWCVHYSQFWHDKLTKLRTCIRWVCPKYF